MPPAQPKSKASSQVTRPDAAAGAPVNPAAAVAFPAPEAGAATGTAAAEPVLAPVEGTEPPAAVVPVSPRAVITDEAGNEIPDFNPDAEIQIPLGLELGCEPFENGELATGIVREVRSGAVTLFLEDLRWLWPVKRERIDLGRGEWIHVATDYPPPGADPQFDRDHRMTAEQRVALAEQLRHEEEAAERLEASRDLQEAVAAAADAQRAHAATLASGVVKVAVTNGPAPRPERAAATSVLARWKGPGVYDGPWVRRSDGRKMGHADPATKDTSGYFPAACVERFAEQFERLG